jgi:flagellar hook-associated protein 3 FlgL
MRVTENSTASMVLNNIQLIRERTDHLQRQASTLLKVNSPGDDPQAASRILDMKAQMASLDQYSRNIKTGQTWLLQMDSTLDGMGNLLSRAKEIATAMANGTYGANDRDTYLNEIREIKNQIVALGNTQVAGRYLFGGFASDRPPFDTAAVNGAAVGTYLGTADEFTMEIDRGVHVAVGYSGDKLLHGSPATGSNDTDILGTLDKLMTALDGNDEAGIRGELTSLDAGLNQVLAVRGELGGRMQRLDNIQALHEATRLNLNSLVSDLQDADIMQVLSDLQQQQTALQATLAASAKTSSISLLDYL